MGDQPTRQGTGFAAGLFGTLPRYPGARPIGDVSHHGVTVRTFAVAHATPRQVVLWLPDELQNSGWRSIERVQSVGETARTAYRKANRSLLVTSAPAPTAASSAQQAASEVQYSYTLGDEGVSVITSG